MKNIRMAVMEDKEACIDVFTTAFLNYDFTKIYTFEDESKRKHFYRECFQAVITLGIERNQLMILEEDGKILAIAQLQAPEEKDYSILNYITHGFHRAAKAGSLSSLLGFIKLSELSEIECHKIEEPHWYLIVFAVNVDYQRKGMGSYLMQNGVLPYIKDHSGKLFALVTNSEGNEKFYLSNGFKTIKKETLHLNGKELDNWTMTMEFV